MGVKKFCSAMHKNRAGAIRPRHDLIICVFVSTPTIDREPVYGLVLALFGKRGKNRPQGGTVDQMEGIDFVGIKMPLGVMSHP